MIEKRRALVVGINIYYEDDNINPLKTPANNAEKIARLLETYGDFEVSRLPVVQGKKQVANGYNSDDHVTKEKLEQAIINLLNSAQTEETALFFFSGHGLHDDNTHAGYLVTSDTDLNKIEETGLSLTWLQDRLKESEVKQLVVWLDCCYSGLFFKGLTVPELQDGRNFCFITACQNEKAWKTEEYSLFTDVLRKGLDPGQKTEDVTSSTLIAYMEKEFKGEQNKQTFVPFSFGKIVLTRKKEVGPDFGENLLRIIKRLEPKDSRNKAVALTAIMKEKELRDVDEASVRQELSRLRQRGSLLQAKKYQENLYELAPMERDRLRKLGY